MPSHSPLRGVRVHLSGSIPKAAGSTDAEGIGAFVSTFARAVLRQGGTLIHGSHPTFQEPLRCAAEPFVRVRESRDALVLVRARQYAETPEQRADIDAQRQYSVVEIVPSLPGRPSESLVPMREWMAERSDVIVAIGGEHWDLDPDSAGVRSEVEEALRRGKPAFLVGGFGGAVAGWLHEHENVLFGLRNGLSAASNRLLAAERNVEQLAAAIVEQIRLLPLARESVAYGRHFRILALDGGGLRGAFTAAVLAKWDEMLRSSGDNDLVKHFDLVAGTSTGAILAIGLCLGMSPKSILQFYRSEGPKIFADKPVLRRWLRSGHDSATLRGTLEKLFGNKLLSKDSCRRLVLPTVRAVHGKAEAIVTAHTADRSGFAGFSAVDAALASSAAPTYFDEAVVEDPIARALYLDGGIWANNPVLPAIAEAVRHLRVPLDRIDVLSVGTTGNETDFTKALGDGMLGWAPHSAELFFAAQEHGAAMLADAFLSPARHMRVNQLTPGKVALDDVGFIDSLALRGRDAGQDSFIAVRSRFLDGFHSPDWRTGSV